MKDSVGNDLKIGDKIAFIPVGYRSMKPGIVFGFSKSGTSVQCHCCKINQYGDWVPMFHEKSPYYDNEGEPILISRFSSYVVKVPQ